MSGPVKLALIASEFNRFVVDPMLEGATDALRRHGVKDEHWTVFRVPGAYELPLAAEACAASGQYDGIIALGAVIRGETAHFDYVAGECARGLMDVQLRHGIPVTMGVLTTENVEQAIQRADPDQANKGFEVALATLQMVELLREIAGR